MGVILRELRRDRSLLLTAVAVAVAFGVIVAVATVLIPNPLFSRPVPVRWWDYAIWGAATPLVGVALALSRRPACDLSGRAGAGGVAAMLAVACPTCNALVVAAIGASGALTWFAPLQPVLGLVGLAALLLVLRHQSRALAASTTPAPERSLEA